MQYVVCLKILCLSQVSKMQELELDNTIVDHLFCFVILLESTDLFEPKVHHMVRNTVMEVSEVGF